MWMDYCEDLAINFLKWHAAEKNQATSQKSLGYLYWLLTQYSTTVLFGQENKNSNFHNFWPDLHNNSDELLNQISL